MVLSEYVLQPGIHFYLEEVLFMLCVFISIKQHVSFCLHLFQERVLHWMKPLSTSLVFGTLADLTRGKAELLAENALLRQQLNILHRQIKRPVYKKTDRLLLVLLAKVARTWKQALVLVQPETLLRWHRELFRFFWKHKSKVRSRRPKLSLETINLIIKEMAAKNRLWGAERIRGELLKLDIQMSKRTIQKYMRLARPRRACGQTWKTFLRAWQPRVASKCFEHHTELPKQMPFVNAF
jgi:putative transposase